MVSLVCTTSHRRPGSTHEFWKKRFRPSGPSCTSNRGRPNGVFIASRFRPVPSGDEVYDAGPLVFSVACLVIVPWQSVHAISVAARTSMWSRLLPCMSCEKWQSTQCIPFSMWMSIRWTGRPLRQSWCLASAAFAASGPFTGSVNCFWTGSLKNSRALFGQSVAAISIAGVGGPTTFPLWSSRFPWRSRLNTARNAHPWLWKSPNWTRLMCGFNRVNSATNSGSDRCPRAADSFGFRSIERMSSSPVGLRCWPGYMRWPSLSSSHHM